MSDSEASAVRVVENDITSSGPTEDKNPSEGSNDVNDTSSNTSTIKNETNVKITGDSTTRRPRQHQETLPNAFSRRETTDSRPVASSVYSKDAEEVPAWLKSAKPTDKYDKYGSRSGTNSARQTTPSDDKYSKYGASSNGASRIKRKRELEDEGEEERDDKSALPEEPVTQPYSVAANPAAYKGTNGDDYQRQYLTFHSLIANKASKDINSIVRTHYNQRTYQSKLQGPRTASPIYKLRNFNNAIKYILLGNYVKKSAEYADTPSSILDLCCGKGGDLNKCEFVNIEQYIGIDISDASVKEAFSRYSQNKARFIPRGALAHKRKDSKRYQFEACFATGDCFTYSVPDILEPNFPGIIDKVFPVDCVSIQFALHYAFETEDKVRMLLLNVSKSLRQGGTFVGTIPSSDFIRDKIVKKDYLPDKDGKKRFGNDLYSVTFEKEPPADGVFRPPFGNKYNYSLKDAIDDVPEYVVPFETLRALCEDYGMTLKYKKNFIDIFNQEIPKYFSRLNKNLVEGMKRSDGKYGAEGMEKEAVAFYIGFVFEKL